MRHRKILAKLSVMICLTSGLMTNGALLYTGSGQTTGDKDMSDYLYVHFIDVGYGDCALVEFLDGKTMLIDAGDEENAKQVVQYLKKRRIKKLNVIIVTHPHFDHLDGVFAVAKEYKIDTIITNEDIAKSENYISLYNLAKERKIKFRQAKRGDEIGAFKGAKVKILHPDILTGDLNNDSLVIKLTYKKVSFLFSADIGEEACEELEKLYKKKLKSRVLKIPYHGKSGTENFIHWVSPEVAVISVGPSEWGGPTEEMLAKYKEAKIPLLRTDEKGSIVIRTDGKKLFYEI